MKKEFQVMNIKCGGCASKVTKKLKSRFPDIEVDLDKEPKIVKATIKDEKDEEYLIETLRRMGYPLTTDDMNMIMEKYLFSKSYVSCLQGKHLIKDN